jgi:hypothetical protein
MDTLHFYNKMPKQQKQQVIDLLDFFLGSFITFVRVIHILKFI